MKPDLNDALYLAGLGLVGTGLWWVFPPAALVTCGAVLVVLGRLGVGRR